MNMMDFGKFELAIVCLYCDEVSKCCKMESV